MRRNLSREEVRAILNRIREYSDQSCALEKECRHAEAEQAYDKGMELRYEFRLGEEGSGRADLDDDYADEIGDVAAPTQ